MLELSEGWDGPIPDLLTKLTHARDISVFLEEATFPHKLTIDGINKQAKESLAKIETSSYSPIFGGDGPLWYRGI